MQQGQQYHQYPLDPAPPARRRRFRARAHAPVLAELVALRRAAAALLHRCVLHRCVLHRCTLQRGRGGGQRTAIWQAEGVVQAPVVGTVIAL
jgi:hypothetical protein